MEVDSPDDYVGASEIEIPDFGSNIAGRGFDDGLCMIDSFGDIGNMKAGAASRKKRGGRKMKQLAGGGPFVFDSADPSSFGKSIRIAKNTIILKI